MKGMKQKKNKNTKKERRKRQIEFIQQRKLFAISFRCTYKYKRANVDFAQQLKIKGANIQQKKRPINDAKLNSYITIIFSLCTFNHERRAMKKFYEIENEKKKEVKLKKKLFIQCQVCE